MMVTITGLEDFATFFKPLPVGDTAGHVLLAVVHGGTPNTPEISHAKLYLVTATGQATLIGSSEPYGKDIDCAPLIIGTTGYLWVSEATPGGSGSTGRIDVYDFPNTVPAATPPSAGIDSVARSLATQARSDLASLIGKLHII